MGVQEKYIKYGLRIKKNAKKSISKRFVKLNNQFEISLVYVWVKSVAHFMRDSTKINIVKQKTSYTSRVSVDT